MALSSRQTGHKTARLHALYTCTYGIVFFGTPHNGSSLAGSLSTAQRLASLMIPKQAALFEAGLVKALEQGSETLQAITEEFVPLMSRFCMFFLWEQLPSDLKYTKQYIVTVESAAPTIDGVEKCSVPADHRGMCKFEDANSPGFRNVLAALKRYSDAAPVLISQRWCQAEEVLRQQRRQEAIELLGGNYLFTGRNH
ncbi:unnamed protein product [Aspergillus oryzae]|nr:unnamed protein product [Aspergillus oryzae]